jgi:hypothetical protein
MAEKSEVAKLRSLAQLDADAVGAYDAAIARVREPLVRERLNEFRIDHVRHVQDLNAFIQRLGGEPVELKPDLKGTAMRSLTAVTSLMGTEAALVAMLGNEEFTNRMIWPSSSSGSPRCAPSSRRTARTSTGT